MKPAMKSSTGFERLALGCNGQTVGGAPKEPGFPLCTAGFS